MKATVGRRPLMALMALILAWGLGVASGLAAGPPRVRGVAWMEAEGARAYTPAATPWLHKHESGGIVYFLYDAPPRIERFDLATGDWLADLTLPDVPTAFSVDTDGLYVSFGRRTSRFALDGTGEFHLRNTVYDVSQVFTFGGFVYLQAYGSVVSADKWTGSPVGTETYGYPMQGMAVVTSLGKAMAPTLGVSPSDLVEFDLLPGGLLGPQRDSPYHGDYPTGTCAFLFPDETRVALDSGIVFSTADMTFAGSLAGGFDDLDFDGDVPIILRQGTLY
ncbi:MAG: hypothetical protein GY769_06900, partial [bacterium]|nr:hypothetical protein [bacterium]